MHLWASGGVEGSWVGVRRDRLGFERDDASRDGLAMFVFTDSYGGQFTVSSHLVHTRLDSVHFGSNLVHNPDSDPQNRANGNGRP
jgi:hypothetical protein